jgi:hypothetical protein
VRIPPARVIRNEQAWQAAQEDAERRRARRDAVTHVVFVHSDHHRFRTRTVDMSDTGLRIERIAGFKSGDRVSVDMGSHIAEGIVVWQNHSHIGVKFIDDAPPSGMWPPLRYVFSQPSSGVAAFAALEPPAPGGQALRSGLVFEPGAPASAA